MMENEDEALLAGLAIEYRALQARMKITYDRIYSLAHKLKADALLS